MSFLQSIDAAVAEYNARVLERDNALKVGDGLQTQITALNAKVAQLEATIVALTPKPRTLYGMNISPGTTFQSVKESALNQRDRIVKTYGGLPVSKVFGMGGNPPTAFRATVEGLVPGKVAFIGFKPDQAALADGTHDAALRSYCASIPTGWKIMLVNWQEPDDEMWKDNTFTDVQHRLASDHLSDVVHATDAYKAGRVEVWECFMGWSLDNASGGGKPRWKDAAVSTKVDGIAWDYYWNNKSDVTSGFQTPLKKMADKAAQFGKPTALLETGDNPDTFPNGLYRADFWAKTFDYAEGLGFRYIIYFNAIGTTGDHRIIPGVAYSEPTRVLLADRMTP